MTLSDKYQGIKDNVYNDSSLEPKSDLELVSALPLYMMEL